MKSKKLEYFTLQLNKCLIQIKQLKETLETSLTKNCQQSDAINKLKNEKSKLVQERDSRKKEILKLKEKIFRLEYDVFKNDPTAGYKLEGCKWLLKVGTASQTDSGQSSEAKVEIKNKPITENKNEASDCPSPNQSRKKIIKRMKEAERKVEQQQKIIDKVKKNNQDLLFKNKKLKSRLEYQHRQIKFLKTDNSGMVNAKENLNPGFGFSATQAVFESGARWKYHNNFPNFTSRMAPPFNQMGSFSNRVESATNVNTYQPTTCNSTNQWIPPAKKVKLDDRFCH